MAFKQGNTYWKLAKGFTPGTEKKYAPDELWVKAVEYFKWVEDNKMRAMTITEFCVFAGITSQTFFNYEKEQAYFDITARIRDIIYSQKFTGAAAGLLESNIIARELGLADKQEIKQDSTITTVMFGNEDKGL